MIGNVNQFLVPIENVNQFLVPIENVNQSFLIQTNNDGYIRKTPFH